MPKIKSQLTDAQARQAIRELLAEGATPARIVKELSSRGYRSSRTGKPLTYAGVVYLVRRSKMPQERRSQENASKPQSPRDLLVAADAQPEDRDPGQGAERPWKPSLGEMLPRGSREGMLCQYWYEKGRAEMAMELSPEFQRALKLPVDVKLI